MKESISKHAKCGWDLRFEIIGVVLLIIATLLTIVTLNGFGIAALFASGVVLCVFNKCCGYVCSSTMPSSMCDGKDSTATEKNKKK